VGTGKSMPYYPSEMTITAIDLSLRMLEQARMHAARDHIAVDLREADVQALPFPDASFDTLIATCVFCSVPDPVLGLRELRHGWCLVASSCCSNMSYPIARFSARSWACSTHSWCA
jgi:SAM-dependent methyltransferase